MCAKFFISFLICLFFSTQAFSNDTSATVASGGVEYKMSKDISMDEEVLKISIDKIDIDYQFTNHSDEDISTTVAFPLPPITPSFLTTPIFHFADWDEMYYAHSFIALNPLEGIYRGSHSNLRHSVEGRSFINFTRTVEGEGYGYDARVVATDGQGKDITARLQENNIPLSVQYLIGAEDVGYLETNKQMAARLKQMKLLDSNGKPNWTTQTIYYWTQYFVAHKTHKIRHSYRPHTGYHFMVAKNPKSLKDIKLGEEHHLPVMNWDDYRPDEKAEKAILKAFNNATDETFQRVEEVRYILTTGANWKGPIKSFRLEVTPSKKGNLVICNWPGPVSRDSEGKYIVEVKDFVPKEDLKILFLEIPE